MQFDEGRGPQPSISGRRFRTDPPTPKRPSLYLPDRPTEMLVPSYQDMLPARPQCALRACDTIMTAALALLGRVCECRSSRDSLSNK